VAKRLFDVVVAALGLVAAAPVLLVAAVGIRLSSPGPILYRARLVGRGGHPFTMYKLRTMHLDQRGSHSVITAERDPRVFAFGRPLRRLKIDELPQLVNVLRGDPERAYAERLLPLVLALDRVYVRHASLWYDATIVGRTLLMIAATLLGRRRFPDPPEMAEARTLLSRQWGDRISPPAKV